MNLQYNPVLKAVEKYEATFAKIRCLLFPFNLQLLGRPGAPESLIQLFDTLRSTSSNAISVPGFPATKDEKTRQPKEKKVGKIFIAIRGFIIFFTCKCFTRIYCEQSIPGRVVTGKEDYNTTEPVTVDPPGFREQVFLRNSDLFSFLI